MISVEIAYAEADNQWLLSLQLESGSTVAEAIEQSAIRELCPQVVINNDHVGIFGKRCRLSDELSNGDRVEIYRPLLIDPREVRRQRATAKSKGA